MLLDTARALAAAGCCVIPTKPDGTKAPAFRWQQYQQQPPTSTDLDHWFTGGRYDGLGVVCGTVSGGLEMLELEGRAGDLGAQLAQALADNGAADLWARLCTGYLEQSPSGGYHWLYRVDGTPRGNTKLARRPATPTELADNRRDKVKVLIETRGEGGYVVVAPSGGRTHPTGRPWVMLAGGPATIPTITLEERDLLHAVCAFFDEMPTTEKAPENNIPGNNAGNDTGARPGDDFNARATWEDILTPHGWTRGRRLGAGWAWTRPGKHPRDGFSATTGTSADGADRLYVFSTSTDFDTETPYSKFAAYAVLKHSGDMSKAASVLREQGYGAPLEEPQTPLSITGDPGHAATDQGPRNPPVLTVIAGGGQQQHETDGATALAPAARTLTRSEDGYSQQLIAAYGDLIRFCPQRGLWLAWDGARWRWQAKKGGIVREYAKKIARDLPAGDNAATRWKKQALSAGGVTGCLTQAETDDRVLVDLGDLDADPWILNTPAGVVDLRTGAIKPADPTTMCTKITTAAPDWTSHDPTWEKFLHDTFGDDQELAGYIQRLIGVSLIGTVREQLLPFAHGPGANGKSTLLEAVMHAIGAGDDGYATAAPAEMLMIRKHQEHPAELAQLAGRRLVVCSELDDGQRFAEAKIKQLTGRDSINARFLYGQPFTFSPTHTIWLLGNQRPQARTGGMAFWRRVKLLEFNRVVPPDQRDPALGDKLAAAGGVVLAWAIRGAVDYLTNGIGEPSRVTEATAAYAADQDTIGRFAEDHLHLTPDQPSNKVLVRQLRTAYEGWCHEVGEEPASARRLTQELRDRFTIDQVKSNGARFYTGVVLLADDADPTLSEPEQPEWWQR